MVECVIQGGDQSEGGETPMTQRAKHQRRAKTHEDDADVLNAVPGEQTLEVVLHQRVEHSE